VPSSQHFICADTIDSEDAKLTAATRMQIEMAACATERQLFLVASGILCCAHSLAIGDDGRSREYGVMIDAGSSGSRCYV